MTFRLSFGAAVLAFVFAVGALAQSHGTGIPAEFPPNSYKGTQYVDSQGCVFIRAKINGATTWVPRMTRKRKQICGQLPTKVAGTTQEPALAPGAELITLDSASAQPVATPKPVKPPKRIAPAKPAAKVKKVEAQLNPVAAPAPRKRAVKVAQPAPRKRAVKMVKPAAAPVQSAANRQTICPNGRLVATRYADGGTRGPVKCLPYGQTGADALTAPVVRGVQNSGGVSASTRVVPTHVAKTRAQVGSFTVPKGYRPAWEDDRLNPHRAEGTLAGRAQMKLYWTETVPRRLIDAGTGRDVTAKVALVYPYTNAAVQSRELGKVTLITKNGQTLKQIKRNTRKTSAAAPAQKPNAAGGRYVQVGMFGQKPNAQATAQRMAQLGLPVRMGKLTRKGKTYSLVMAGPFTENASATRALAQVRRAGFKDAFIR